MHLINSILLISIATFHFAGHSQDRYDIVIDELMVDPSPQVRLPNYEWIELKNISSTPLNLMGWRVADANSQSGPMPVFILRPDSFVVICSGTALPGLSIFGAAISVTSFPLLDNDGDQVVLTAADNRIIHAIAYSASWYRNELKKEGGWSLEMIDTKNPCGNSNNWNSSNALNGGTPANKNSVDGINDDKISPSLKRTYSIDSVTIIAVFDKALDSTGAAETSNYNIDGGIKISSSNVVSPLFDMVELKLSTPMQNQTVYNVTADNIFDCEGNVITTHNKAKAGIPEDASVLEIIINEILFNPRANGYDYIEVYNRSNKIFDANNLYLANRNSYAVISSIRKLSSIPFYIFPGEYIVITEDADNLQLNYLVKDPENILVLPSLPSYPDEEGVVIILNKPGNVVDEVKYKDYWHFRLIENAEGVSLERIDPDSHSQEPANWHSAASTSGYGTPTYRNSQYKQTEIMEAIFEVFPKIFSPDNDGRDDILSIQYKVDNPGYVANVTIFDINARPIRRLVKNGTLGLQGYWNWDGLDEKGNQLSIGTYVVFTEIFNLRGKTKNFKNIVVLARKLN